MLHEHSNSRLGDTVTTLVQLRDVGDARSWLPDQRFVNACLSLIRFFLDRTHNKNDWAAVHEKLSGELEAGNLDQSAAISQVRCSQRHAHESLSHGLLWYGNEWPRRMTMNGNGAHDHLFSSSQLQSASAPCLTRTLTCLDTPCKLSCYCSCVAACACRC